MGKFGSINPMDEIMEPIQHKGGLYLGNIEAARNSDLLIKHNIRAVLTVAEGTGLNYKNDLIKFHLIINAQDHEDYDICQHFEQAIEFIHQNRQYTNVLVHCFAGVNRSASCVAAYLITIQQMNYQVVYDHIKNIRPCVLSNLSFQHQLMNYEKTIQFELFQKKDEDHN